MLLSELLNGIVYASNNFANVNVRGISIDSKKTKPGDIFVCLTGKKANGHNYAHDAIKAGAVAIVCEKYISPATCPQIKIKDSRQILTIICANFYNNPQKHLKFIGVTGTNGKTTTTTLIYDIMTKNDFHCALIGTNGIYFEGEYRKSDLTTPDPMDFFRLLNEIKEVGVTHVVMEVSAHAIALKKLFGVEFEVVGITNLSQDHLDYFNSLDDYFETKLGFVAGKNVKSVVFNIDDDKLFQSLNGKVTGLTYGKNRPSDVFACDVHSTLSGSNFFVNFLDNIFQVQTTLIGDFNIQNILCAICICSLLGISIRSITNALETSGAPEGRMQRLRLRNGAYVIIDYAHTPDAIEKVLSSLNNIPHNRIITLFGCGGDRDREKRTIMGRIAESQSDKVIVTSDNPRSENARKIIKDITKEMKSFKAILSRKRAIKRAIKISRQGDLVAILGKGHERGQIIKDKILPFSDLDEVIKAGKLQKV